MKASWNHREALHCIPDKHPAFHHSHGLMAFTCSPSPQLKVSSCQQPWPGSLAHCCFGKHIFKTPWFWDKPRCVLARGGSTRKAVWNHAPLCHMEWWPWVMRSWHIPSFPHMHYVFCSEGMSQALVLLCTEGPLRSQVSCCGFITLLGWLQRGMDKVLRNGHFFLHLSIKYLSKLLSVSLFWSKTIFLFVYLNTLYQLKLTESLQRSHWLAPTAEFPATHYSQWIWFIHVYLCVFIREGWHNPYSFDGTSRACSLLLPRHLFQWTPLFLLGSFPTCKLLCLNYTR